MLRVTCRRFGSMRESRPPGHLALGDIFSAEPGKAGLLLQTVCNA